MAHDQPFATFVRDGQEDAIKSAKAEYFPRTWIIPASRDPTVWLTKAAQEHVQ